LADSPANQLYWQCIANVKGNESCYAGLAGWRKPFYLASIYTPVFFALIEFCFNRIEMPPKTVFLQVGLSLGYLWITFLG
jgi:hypothetical protein